MDNYKPLSLNDMTILGLVAESKKPINGDKLKKVIENRGMRNWTKIGKSSIYHSLNKLSKSHHIEIIEESIEREGDFPPTKRVFYNIAEFGMNDLRNNIIERLSNPDAIDDPFVIAFANAPLLSKTELRQALVARMQELINQKVFLESQIKYFGQVDAKGIDINGNLSSEHLGIIQGLFSRPLKLLLAEIEWITSFIISEEQSKSKIGENNDKS